MKSYMVLVVHSTSWTMSRAAWRINWCKWAASSFCIIRMRRWRLLSGQTLWGGTQSVNTVHTCVGCWSVRHGMLTVCISHQSVMFKRPPDISVNEGAHRAALWGINHMQIITTGHLVDTCMTEVQKRLWLISISTDINRSSSRIGEMICIKKHPTKFQHVMA